MKYFLFGLLVALQIVDVATTQYVLAHGGVEMNPAMALLQRHSGDAWIVFKAAFVAATAFCVWRIRSDLMESYLAVAAGLYVAIVVNNVYALLGF